MTLNLQYSHSTTPIAEAWLIKALRLVYSKKPGDREKLRKLYKDACDNESQIVHMTLAEALREPRESISTNHDTSERDTSTSMHSTQRIRTSQSINDLPSLPSCICTTTPTISNANDSTSLVNVTHNETSVYATSTTTSVISSDRLVNTTTNNSGILNSTVIGTTSHSSSTVTNRANKRNKVAFFNIFDVAPSTSNSSTSSNTTVVSSKTNIQQRSSNQLENTISVESINSNTTVQLCNNTEVTVDSFINNSATGTSKIQINSELSNPIIDLTLTDNDVLSTSTTSTDTNCTLSLSEDKLSTTKVMNSTYLPTVSQTQSSSSSSFTSSVDSTMISNDTLIASNQENSNLNTNNAHLLLAASLVADLVCRLCGRLSQQPQLEPDKKTINANVLVECLKCGSLYHQLCHQPFILMSTPKQQWICANCSIISTTSIVTTADPLIISTSSITSFNSTMNLTSSINSTCNVLSTDSMISCNVIESSDILSTDMTVITGNDHNDSSSSSSSSSSFSSSSVILSNPVPVSSSSTISTITTLSLLPTTAIATNQLCLSSSSPPPYPPSSSSSSSSTTTTTITSTIPSTSTINIGARKRKPAFTSPLSSLPRKLKDDYN